MKNKPKFSPLVLIILQCRTRLEEAAQAEGVPLEYYTSFDATWKQPWKYFDNITAIDKSKLSKCSATTFWEPIRMQQYLDITGDTGGVTLVGGNVTGTQLLWVESSPRF